MSKQEIEMETQYSYSARFIATFLDEHGITHRPYSSRACMFFLYEHGFRADFPVTVDGSACIIALSVQTCPPVAGPAFAETALQFINADNDIKRSTVACRELG